MAGSWNIFAHRSLRPALLVISFLGGSTAFVVLKARAVKQRSEEAKRNSTRGEQFYVATGRSGGGI